MKYQNTNIDDLIIDCISGEADANQIKIIKQWLAEDENNVHYYHQIKAIWLASIQNKNPYHFDPQIAWFRLINRIKQPGRIISNFLKYAAVALISLMLGALGTYYLSTDSTKLNEQIAMNEVEAPYGARSKVNLPDGSMVWLNSGSKIVYPNEFTGNSRKVKLQGEGYFEVKSNPTNPFIVNAKNLVIKALGTSFNVKSYPDEGYVETTLIEGTVAVHRESNVEKSILLKPNQKITIYENEIQNPEPTLKTGKPSKKSTNNLEHAFIETNVNIEPEVSWKDSYWVFQDERLASLVRKLERRYDVAILLEDSALNNFRYTGTLKDESLEEVLEVLTMTSPLIYSINGTDVKLNINKDFQDKLKDSWKTD